MKNNAIAKFHELKASNPRTFDLAGMTEDEKVALIDVVTDHLMALREYHEDYDADLFFITNLLTELAK